MPDLKCPFPKILITIISSPLNRYNPEAGWQTIAWAITWMFCWNIKKTQTTKSCKNLKEMVSFLWRAKIPKQKQTQVIQYNILPTSLNNIVNKFLFLVLFQKLQNICQMLIISCFSNFALYFVVINETISKVESKIFLMKYQSQ